MSVSIIGVANQLGYYAYPLCLSRVCTHQNINKWSKWKPISYSADTLTDNIIKWTNCGFKLDGTIPFDFGISQYKNVLDYAKNSGGTWNYQGPTGTTASPYRLGDFRNYNHDAFETFEAGASAITTTGEEVNVGVGLNEYADIMPDNFGMISNKETSRYYLLYRQKGSSYLPDPISGSTMWNEDEGWCTPEAPLSYPRSSQRPKTFECCLIAHEEGQPMHCYLIPNSYTEVTFNPYVPPTPSDYVSVVCDITEISQNQIQFDYEIYLDDPRQNVTINWIRTGGETQVDDESTYFDFRTTIFTGVTLDSAHTSVSGSFTVNGSFHTGYISGDPEVHHPDPDEEYDDYVFYQKFKLLAQISISGLPNGLSGTYYLPDYGGSFVSDLDTAAEQATSSWWKFEELYG